MNKKLWIALVLTLVVGAFVVERAARAIFVTWGTGFELSPAHTDPVSQGDTRIRELKENVRTRLQTEMDFGDNTLGTANTDTGRMLKGSCRPFFQNAAPTQIVNADTTGSTALDDGRLWIDVDGADGIAGTADDYTAKVFDTADGAFHAVTTVSRVHTDVITVASDTTTRAGCLNAAAYRDFAADCGATLAPAVVIPATGNWIIRATAQATLKSGSNINTHMILQYDDGTTTTYCDNRNDAMVSSKIFTAVFTCLVSPATNAKTYTFRIVGKPSGATADLNPVADVADPLGATTTQSFINVTAESKDVGY